MRPDRTDGPHPSPTPRTPRRTRRGIVVGTVAALALAAWGCGDDGGRATPTTGAPTTAVSTTTAPVPTTGATTPSSTTSTTAAAPTTTRNDDAAVRAVFTTFFDGTASVEARVAALDGGETYRQMLVDAAADPQGARLHAQVRNVTFPADAECAAVGAAPPCAIVTFDLLVGSFPALAAHQGAATRRSGTWKVTAATWCDVVKIGGDTCPA